MDIKLTEKEKQLLKAARNSDFGDAGSDDFDNCPWVFDVVDKSSMPPKSAGGVLSSLVKKN